MGPSQTSYWPEGIDMEELRPIDLLPERFKEALWNLSTPSYRVFSDPFGPVFSGAKGILSISRKGAMGMYFRVVDIHLIDIFPHLPTTFYTVIELIEDPEGKGRLIAKHWEGSRMNPHDKFEGELILTPHDREFEFYRDRIDRHERWVKERETRIQQNPS